MVDASDLGWGVLRRFEFIEWRAYWEGRLNRGDLERQFNISTPQASVDLRNYREIAAGNIEYNGADKTYYTTPNFRPQFLRLSPERYLAQLQTIATGSLDISETWFSEVPPVDVVPPLARGLHAYALRAIVKAIRTKGQMEINYQSLTNERVRTICPHALGFDGHRWHIRAWSPDRAEHRDYVFGRILSFSEPRPCLSDPPEDLGWNTYVELVLISHPGLSDQQRAAIEHDFQMENGEKVVRLRLALAFYFIRRHNLDIRGEELSAERLQIFLKNYADYEHIQEEIQAAAALKAKAWSGERLAPANPA